MGIWGVYTHLLQWTWLSSPVLPLAHPPDTPGAGLKDNRWQRPPYRPPSQQRLGYLHQDTKLESSVTALPDDLGAFSEL